MCIKYYYQGISVQFSSVVSDSLWLHGLQHARTPCPSPTPGVYSNSYPLSQGWHPTISSCHPLLLTSVFPSIRVFSNESALHIRWPKYWSFSFNINPSNEHSGPISFRMDWLDLLAVQGTLNSLLQHHSSKASILRCLAFFIVQLSRPFMTTGKTIALTRWTFVGKVMSLLFNMLSRLVITFLPRSKHCWSGERWLRGTGWASGGGEIPHVEGQEQRLLFAGPAVWRIPHVQDQRNPSKTVRGVKSCLESYPIPTRDAQRAQKNPVLTRTQGPHRDWDRTVCESLLWKYQSAVVCRRDGLWVQQTWLWHKPSWRRAPLTRL